jgi:hypothetical protein
VIAAEHNRRREDLAISVDIILRSVSPIADLVRALEGAGGCTRLGAAPRAELAGRRGCRLGCPGKDQKCGSRTGQE